jgi:hypothetical protein
MWRRIALVRLLAGLADSNRKKPLRVRGHRDKSHFIQSYLVGQIRTVEAMRESGLGPSNE